MKNPYILKTKNTHSLVFNNKGIVLIELVMIVVVLAIIAMTGRSLFLKNTNITMDMGTKIVHDMEHYYLLSIYSPYYYEIVFEDDSYTIRELREGTSEIIRTEEIPEEIKIINMKKRIVFDYSGKMNIPSKNLTIKIENKQNKNDYIYITIVPVSNRILLTKDPSNNI